MSRQRSGHAAVRAAESLAVAGSEAHEAERQRARAVRKAVHRFTALVLVTTAIILIVAAFPTLGRLLEQGPPQAARRGIARAMWAKGWAVGPPEPDAQRGARAAPGLDLGARLRDAPQRRAERDLLEELFAPEELEPEPSHESGGAIAREAVVLLDRADPGGHPAGAVAQGQLLIVIKDFGEWLLVAFKEAEQFKLGWVKREKVLMVR